MTTNRFVSRGVLGRIASASLAAAFLLAPSGTAHGQCQVLSQPASFDPPAVPLPSYFNGNQDRISIGGPANARRLAVLYNYGYLVYDVTTGTPVKIQTKDLLTEEKYPKNGDGQSRTGPLSMSPDAQRILVPWTDRAGFGTVVFSTAGGSFTGGGDFSPPAGGTVVTTASVRSGSRWLGFAIGPAPGSATQHALYVADLTSLDKNVQAGADGSRIASEPAAGLTLGKKADTAIVTVDGASKSFVVIRRPEAIVVGDVSMVGTSPNLSTNFVWRSFAPADFGLAPGSGGFRNVAAAFHPANGDLYIFAEAATTLAQPFTSAGVSLARMNVATGALTVVGTALPSEAARGSMPASVLVPSGSELLAAHLEADASGALNLNVRSSVEFSRNAAAGIVFSRPETFVSFVGFANASGTLYLYFGLPGNAYVASLSCSTAPTPLAASLSVEKVPAGGGAAVPVPAGGTVFVGDELRLKPSFAPPDGTSPVLEWRFDYDFHEGAAGDSGAAAPFLANPDVFLTQGATFPTQLGLVGPCDPAQVPQGAASPVASTGAGCWESVTTNGAFTTTGSPDFSSVDPAPGATVPLSVAFEAKNALNGSGSSVAKQVINWKVPRALLKSTSLLSGGVLLDASEGSPAATGYRWYVSSTPVGQAGDDVLTLRTTSNLCTGPSCNPGLTAAGSYRYWVSVPYRNGFRTPECPGLSQDGTTCSGEPGRTVTVTDVVLGFTVPGSAFQSIPTITIPSSSIQGTGVQPCGGTDGTGLTYDLCAASGGSCPEGAFNGTGLVATNPFSAGGKLTIPTPAIGSWGVRIRYSYTTSGSCTSPIVAQWPTAGSGSDWAPVTVALVDPKIKLLLSTTSESLCDMSDSNCMISTLQKGKAYAYIQDGSGSYVQDPAPPASLSWNFGNGKTSAVQGAEFNYTTAGDYTITLNGYGAPKTILIEAYTAVGGGGGGGTGGTGGTGGGGGGSTALTVSSISFSTRQPTMGQAVTMSCNHSGGTSPYTYDWAFGDGQTYSGSNRTVSHAYSTEGTKYVGCTVWDASGSYGQTVDSIVVAGGGGGGGGDVPTSCSFTVRDAATQATLPFFANQYNAASGQPLSFVAADVTQTPSWNFGNGATASGNTVNYTYNITQTVAQVFNVQMTAGSGCSKSYEIIVDPPNGQSFLDFSVADAGTGTALARSGDTFEARAGQALRFTATGTSGAVSWSFGDGETSAEATPVKTYGPLVDTTYDVTLTNDGRTKTYKLLVKGSTGAPLTGNYTFRYADGSSVNKNAVQPNKPITFTGTDQATSYQWDFGDGSALGSGSPVQHTFGRGGNFTVRLTTARTGVTPVTTSAPTVFKVLDPPDPLLWVAAGMAYADGSKGELFQSDLSIYNPGTQAATVSLAFVSGAGWDGASKAEWRTLGVGPGETRAFSNILAGFFGLGKGTWGVVLVRGDNVPVSPVIVSRTYNAAGAGSGTFGLSVPAMSVANGVRPQSAAAGNFLAGLRHDDSFRTNLTVANLKDETAEVEVVFRDPLGKVLGAPARVRVEARGVKQLNGALSAVPVEGDGAIGGAGYSSPASHFSAEIRLTKGTGVYPYATVIDQGTGDSIVVTPTPRPSPAYRIPGIVRVKGKNGPYWVSDLAILNPSNRERKLRITYSYVKTGTSLRIDASQSLTFAPYEMKVGVDFVKVWLGLAEDDPYGYASSYVDIAPAPDDAAPNEPVVVAGKTYTPSGKGSVGLQIDPFVLEDGIGAQAANKRIVLSGLAANASYRTNVALFLTPGSTGNVQVDVHVLDAFGRESKKFLGVGLDANTPFVQLNGPDLFADLTTDDLSRATVVVDNPRGTALVGAYATVIDDKSEDATFVAGQPAP